MNKLAMLSTINAVDPVNTTLGKKVEKKKEVKEQFHCGQKLKPGFSIKNGMLSYCPEKPKETNTINLNNHLTNTNNPHKTTKAQVGLENVENFTVATQAETQAGTISHLTPEHSRELTNIWIATEKTNNQIVLDSLTELTDSVNLDNNVSQQENSEIIDWSILEKELTKLRNETYAKLVELPDARHSTSCSSGIVPLRDFDHINFCKQVNDEIVRNNSLDNYQIAVNHGFSGTEQEWLNSLNGINVNKNNNNNESDLHTWWGGIKVSKKLLDYLYSVNENEKYHNHPYTKFILANQGISVMSDNNTTIQRTKQKPLEDVKKHNNHIGSTFDSFLEEEGIKEQVDKGAQEKADKLHSEKLNKK